MIHRRAAEAPLEMDRLLKQVSRSFYLTLRALPMRVRPQIGLAYLLARTSDSIADTHLVPVERRLSALREMRAAIVSAGTGRTVLPPDFGRLAEAQEGPAGRGTSGERTLLESAGAALEALRALGREDRQLVCEVLHTITLGQETDLARFGCADRDNIRSLAAENELEEYTYGVAGCVGEFWTRMCRAHLFPDEPLDDTALLCDGVRFGKGLQLVNILRDIPGDLRQGRCYIPADRLAGSNLTARDLLKPENIGRFRPVYDIYLEQAREHLAAGWRYTEAIPRSQVRVRLACAWPILIGMRTLALLSTGNVLEHSRRIRVDRSEIRGLIFSSLIRYPFPRFWNQLFHREEEQAT